MRVEIRTAPPEEPASLPYMEAHKIDPSTGEDEMALAVRRWRSRGTWQRRRCRAATRNPNDPTSWGKVGRNEACPCGSGKKYKHCHGRFAEIRQQRRRSDVDPRLDQARASDVSARAEAALEAANGHASAVRH